MIYNTTEEVITLVKAFEERTLSKNEWTHAAHLTVGLYYCLRYSFGVATNHIRDGIHWLNDTHGVANTRTSGYHETLTIFWMITVKQFIESSKSYNLAEMANQLIARSNDPKLPLKYYSHEVLFSTEAREHHVQPDLDRFYLFVNSSKLTSRVRGESTMKL